MQKTDETIRRICIRSIKQHAFELLNYFYTRIFENESLSEIEEYISSCFIHQENELPICMTFVDTNNWTLLTTKRVISNINGDIKQTASTDIIKKTWNDFKGYNDKPFTIGQLTLKNDLMLDIFIETGKASMIMIYGIKQLSGLQTSAL